MTHVTEGRTYKPRSELEMNIALDRLLMHRQTLCVPPQDTDEDIVLGDAIDELLDLREQVAALRRQQQARQEMEQA